MSVARRTIKQTLTAVELNKEQTLELTLSSGELWKLEVVDTGAEVVKTARKELHLAEPGFVSEIRFHADVKINGEPRSFEREISSQKSFYKPWVVDGVRIWLDAVDDVFNFMDEFHGDCRSNKIARPTVVKYLDSRWAFQEEHFRICPDILTPWCALPEGGLKIEECYRGEDTWMGTYRGHTLQAHGGLDINHPSGAPLFAPLDLDDNFLWESVEMGQKNNRWRGIRRWGNGCEWILQTAHIVELTVPEHRPIQKGKQYAVGAGTAVGVVDHSHFIFRVYDDGNLYLLDPWILFWQMYRDEEQKPKE
jgi:hypothetical protein